MDVNIYFRDLKIELRRSISEYTSTSHRRNKSNEVKGGGGSMKEEKCVVPMLKFDQLDKNLNRIF